jgi:hypothetical protein
MAALLCDTPLYWVVHNKPGTADCVVKVSELSAHRGLHANGSGTTAPGLPAPLRRKESSFLAAGHVSREWPHHTTLADTLPL